MKVVAGGKPWRRKPSAAPAVSAASTPGGGAIEREGDRRQGRRRDHADPGGEPVDAVDQVDHVDHRDDPDHGDDVAEVDRAAAGQVEQVDRSRARAGRRKGR